MGRVGRPHGLDGSFFVEDPSTAERRFAVGAELLVAGEPARVIAARHARGRPVIKLDRRAKRGSSLEVQSSDLPQPADDSFYVFQLVGLMAVEQGGRELGRVADVAPRPANDVLELETGIALPMVEDCVLAVDLEGGQIEVARGYADSA